LPGFCGAGRRPLALDRVPPAAARLKRIAQVTESGRFFDKRRDHQSASPGYPGPAPGRMLRKSPATGAGDGMTPRRPDDVRNIAARGATKKNGNGITTTSRKG
jgi:hypothetical protein